MLLLPDEIKDECFRTIKERVKKNSGQGWWHELYSIQFPEGGLEAAAAAHEKSEPIHNDWWRDRSRFTPAELSKSSTETEILATVMLYQERNGKLTAESMEFEFRVRIVNCPNNLGGSVGVEIIRDGVAPSMDTQVQKWKKEARELHYKFHQNDDLRGHLSGIILHLIAEREKVRPVIAALKQYHAQMEEEEQIGAEIDYIESRRRMAEISDSDIPF
jgi:hypothetical protein